MNFENWVLTNSEPLQYLIFFGCLLVLGFLEHLRPAHSSPAPRVKRWPVNYAITFLNVVVMGILPISLISASQFAHSKSFGLFNVFEFSLPILVVGVLAARGFISWLNHFLMHKVSLFWRIHQVHHLDTQLDTSTTVRFHPLEFVANLAVSLPLVLLFGGPTWIYLVYELLDAGINVFSHSNIRLPERLNSGLSWFIVTPNVHQIHHSSFQPETDSNYGAVFTIWDRLFGTFRTKDWPFDSNFTFGLEYWRHSKYSSFWFLLTSPFRTQKDLNK